MFDLQLETNCDHKIFDEQLSLQGSSPLYFAILKYQANANTNAINIREFATTNSLTNYSYVLNGMTNWSLSTDGRQIYFNTLGLGGPGSAVASFADGSSLIDPQRIYFATYYALAGQCPMDQSGTNIRKDVRITPSGQFATVVNTDKVRQMIWKALLTVQGSNQFQLSYGSLASALIGSKASLLTQFQLQQSIQQAVQFLITQQQLTTIIPPAEQILRVNSVQVSQDVSDPRTLNVALSITVGTYQQVTIGFNLLLD